MAHPRTDLRFRQPLQCRVVRPRGPAHALLQGSANGPARVCDCWEGFAADEALSLSQEVTSTRLPWDLPCPIIRVPTIRANPFAQGGSNGSQPLTDSRDYSDGDGSQTIDRNSRRTFGAEDYKAAGAVVHSDAADGAPQARRETRQG